MILWTKDIQKRNGKWKMKLKKYEDAFEVLRDGYDEEGIAIPLGLEPLGEVGTRVTIPFLSFEAREAIDSGELHRWLSLQWWRQIQLGLLSITVDTGDGMSATAGISRCVSGTAAAVSMR